MEKFQKGYHVFSEMFPDLTEAVKPDFKDEVSFGYYYKNGDFAEAVITWYDIFSSAQGAGSRFNDKPVISKLSIFDDAYTLFGEVEVFEQLQEFNRKGISVLEFLDILQRNGFKNLSKKLTLTAKEKKYLKKLKR